MPKYTYPLANGKTLTLEGETEPSQADVEAEANQHGVRSLLMRAEDPEKVERRKTQRREAENPFLETLHTMKGTAKGILPGIAATPGALKGFFYDLPKAVVEDVISGLQGLPQANMDAFVKSLSTEGPRLKQALMNSTADERGQILGNFLGGVLTARAVPTSIPTILKAPKPAIRFVGKTSADIAETPRVRLFGMGMGALGGGYGATTGSIPLMAAGTALAALPPVVSKVGRAMERFGTKAGAQESTASGTLLRLEQELKLGVKTPATLREEIRVYQAELAAKRATSKLDIDTKAMKREQRELNRLSAMIDRQESQLPAPESFPSPATVRESLGPLPKAGARQTEFDKISDLDKAIKEEYLLAARRRPRLRTEEKQLGKAEERADLAQHRTEQRGAATKVRVAAGEAREEAQLDAEQFLDDMRAERAAKIQAERTQAGVTKQPSRFRETESAPTVEGGRTTKSTSYRTPGTPVAGVSPPSARGELRMVPSHKAPAPGSVYTEEAGFVPSATRTPKVERVPRAPLVVSPEVDAAMKQRSRAAKAESILRGDLGAQGFSGQALEDELLKLMLGITRY